MPSPPAPAPCHLVLVVEDDDALRGALQFLLVVEEFRVEAFASGEALLAYELPERDACLVIDDRLPGISGIETLLRLRQREVGLPALIITTHPEPAQQLAALAAQARIVEKPLVGDALLNNIRAALASQDL